MAEEVVNNEVISNEHGEPQRELRPEEQEALARLKESRKTESEKAEGMPEGFNEDGTPKEELIGGKFKSQDDLLQAYQELEKKLSQPKEKEETQESSEKTEVTNAEGKSVDVSKFEQEYAQNGELSEKSYKDLEKLGFSKVQVDRYIQGSQAYANGVKNEVYSLAGGEENYTELINWAANNIDRDVIDDYNKALQDLDEARIKRNIEYMKYKMEQSAPRETRRIEGDSGGVGLQPYPSKLEWQKAATNRLYGKDPKYTKMVDQRYLASRRKGLI